QDSERRRIARDLHDGVGQYLAAIRMSCDAALSRSAATARDAALKDAINVLDRCLSEVRTMSYLLHPPLLDEMGLSSAVPWYVEGFTTRSGICVDLDLSAQIARLPADVEVAVFRVLQESLTNIHRHSGSKTATIRLALENGNVVLSVKDDGRGSGAGENGV